MPIDIAISINPENGWHVDLVLKMTATGPCISFGRVNSCVQQMSDYHYCLYVIGNGGHASNRVFITSVSL